MALFGYSFFKQNLHGVNNHLNKVGINVEVGGADFFPFLNLMMGWFTVTSTFVVVYGLREKFRTRFDECGHLSSCSAALIKCLIKAFIHTLVVACAAVSILLFIFAEAIFCVLIASKEACDSGKDALESVLGIITSNDDLLNFDDDFKIQEQIDEICDAVKRSRNSAQNVCIGALVCLVGWFVIVSYWYK